MDENRMDGMLGKDVLKALAETYQQLYIPPGGEGSETGEPSEARKRYDDVVKKGKKVLNRSLSHFVTDEQDSLVYKDTPAGKVCVITLHNRADFVTFLRIMANRCAMTPIPDTQGASLIDGVINWEKIRAHKKEYLAKEQAEGSPAPDWHAEFLRFTEDKRNYLDTLIVLSFGPYSGIDAEQAVRTIPENTACA